MLQESDHAVALTGAGISTNSGIPDFRGEEGLWNRHDPMAVASIDGLKEDPDRFYEFWVDRFSNLGEAEPNETHRTLAALEEEGLLEAVITQNIDGLHKAAGTSNLIEVHGSYKTSYCLSCGAESETRRVIEQFKQGGKPFCDECGGLLRPDVVLFGEDLPPSFSVAVEQVEKADMLVVLGSSLEVYPVASLVPYFRNQGGRLVIVNLELTQFDSHADLVIRQDLQDFTECFREII